jgi:beta-glucosidase
VTAILWAGIPGQESGSAIADILYGRVNPSGKLPFTLAANREDYGTQLLYQPNNGMDAPQQSFSEGIFIDYRHFDKANVTPVYEFGFGLSFTSFAYSDIQVQDNSASAPAYVSNMGLTAPAPTFGNFSTNPSDYQFPANFTEIPLYIYPYLNSTDLRSASQDANYGKPSLPPNATDGSAQPKVPAGGGPGGNPRLYDVLFVVSATIKNTGTVPGDEVVQLYISLGNPQSDAPKVLRGFDKLHIDPGQSVQFTANITRRDVMNWNPAIQNWEITKYEKKVYVGASSRNLPLSAVLISAGKYK